MKTVSSKDTEDEGARPPEEDSKPPAKRPRRKAALKSEELIAEMAEEEDDATVQSPAKRPRRKRAALKSEESPAAEADFVATAKKRSSGDSAPIPLDAMVNVMEFLPPRSLYNIALTCKSLREMVTTKMVVQSALIHGGHAKKTMEELYKLMKNQSIYPPSPLRLLRLANGKTCEFCLQSGTNHVRPGLGVFACWDCVSSGRQGRWNSWSSSRSGSNCNSSSGKLTKAWKTSWSRYTRKPIYRTILSHSRVASNGYGTNHYFWSEHRSGMTGEKVGPIVTWGDVDDLCNYYDKLKAAAVAKEAAVAASTSGSAIASTAVATADKEGEEEDEEDAPSLTNGEWIERYLAKNLNAPPKEDYEEFNETFTNTVLIAERVSREREELKKSKRDDKKQSKVAKVEKMLDDLTALIDEPFRQYAMKVHGKESYLKDSASTTRPCLSLETSFINTWLEPYIKSPSKMTKKAMKEMAEKINVELRRIEKLLEMDFLADDDEFEAAAKSFFRECFPDLESLFVKKQYYSQNQLSSEFQALMQGDRFFGALSYLKGNDLSPMLLTTEPSASLGKSSKYLDDSGLKKMATKAWHQTNTSTYKTRNAENDSWAAAAFAAGHRFFVAALAKFEKFGTWLEGKVEEDKRAAFLNEILDYSWYFNDFMKEDDFDKIWERMARLARSSDSS